MYACIMFVCVGAYMRAYVRVYVRAGVRACVCASRYIYVHICTHNLHVQGWRKIDTISGGII